MLQYDTSRRSVACWVNQENLWLYTYQGLCLIMGWHFQHLSVLDSWHRTKVRALFDTLDVQYSPWYPGRDHFAYAPSQWETTLYCNVISYWQGAFTELSLPWIYNVIHGHCLVLFWLCWLGLCGFTWYIYPYPSGLLHWQWGNHMIAPLPVK